MGYAETMRILGGINCGLASIVNYAGMRQNGVDPGYAAMSLNQNIFNGIARNEMAYMMQKHGCSFGNNINMAYGFGNPVSNSFATAAFLNVSTPWMAFNYCNPMMYYSPMPMTPFCGGLGYGMSPGFWC